MDKKKVLLCVEDNPSNMQLIENIAIKIGLEFHGAESGEEGVEKAATLKPDVILMDIALPGIDGVETTRLLKANANTRNIPIIAVSAHVQKSDSQKALDAGCSDYLTKPINLNQLISKLEKSLGERLPKPYRNFPDQYKKILIVDDDPANVTLLQKFFKAKGLTVLRAGNGAEALELLLRESVDLIISDVLMPEMDGFELCYTVNRSPQLSHIPFIFYSGYFDSTYDDEFVKKIGAAAHIQRPLGLQTFYTDIEMALRDYKPTETTMTEEEFMAEHLDRYKTRLLLAKPRPAAFDTKTPKLYLEASASYLIEEESPQLIYEIYRKIIGTGALGLSITRENPETLARKLGPASENTNFVWLSDTEIGEHVSTKNLTSLSVITWDFLQKVDMAVVLLDGFEYLCSQHSFESSLGFLQLLNERISTQNAISLLSINPKALDQKQFMQLKKELKPLDLPKTPS